MDDYIKLIGSWLTDESGHTADILTIVGISGIGKTSLARYVFGLHSIKFYKSSFIEGINIRCKESFNGLLDLQKQLHGEISKKVELQVNGVSMYTSKIESVLSRKKVFIVLDDIGSPDQVDALLGNKGLHPGSKIIITTKDASLTERCALFNPQVQPMHKKVSLNGLSRIESLRILYIYAFSSRNPKRGYGQVAEKLVKYCQGHPLALKLLGRSLHKQDVAYWEEYINGLKKEPHSGVKEVLKMSIDSLPSENNKELFKHIACFFVGMDKDEITTILTACEINTRSGITILIDKCLLSIGSYNELRMHPLVQEMGRDLIRQEKPSERTRLWCHEESLEVLKKDKGTENLLGLVLDMRMLDTKKLRGSFELNTKSLSKMDNLMLLQLNYVKLNGCFNNFPEELTWLCMHGFPSKSIPLELPMENLVALDMSYSNIESFDMSCNNPQPNANKQKVIESCSNDKKILGSLKILDLSFCEQLHSIGGFLELPALERLIVRKCISLIDVCETVGQCVELVHIVLSDCCKLKRVPVSLRKLKKLKTLLLDSCASSESKAYTRNMNSSTIAITEAIPTDLKFFAFSLPSSLVTLSLAYANLSNESFPVDWSFLSILEELCLDGNPIVTMPNCVRTLPRLKNLSMSFCYKMMSIEYPPHTLTKLSIHADNEESRLLKVKFDSEMSPLRLTAYDALSPHTSYEVDGILKIQRMAGVGENVLYSLGWTNIDFTKESHFTVSDRYDSSTECETQHMYYEFGIFSTFYMGKEMPDGIKCRSNGPSISFTIPSSPMKIRGLNLCCIMEMNPWWPAGYFELPLIKISNITKNHTWLYMHFIGIVFFAKKCCLSMLSHWMFGPNEMKCGDHITIEVEVCEDWGGKQVISECGVGIVYDEDGKNEEEEEDLLGYYKSWNHIIGGDLYAFQLTTGEYALNNRKFTSHIRHADIYFNSFVDRNVRYKEEEVWFKAFSQKKAPYGQAHMNLGGGPIPMVLPGQQQQMVPYGLGYVSMGSVPYDVENPTNLHDASALANDFRTEQRTMSDEPLVEAKSESKVPEIDYPSLLESPEEAEAMEASLADKLASFLSLLSGCVLCGRCQ